MDPQPPSVRQNLLDFGYIAPGNTKTMQLDISNPTPQPLLWRVDKGETSWLAVEKSAGTLQPHETKSVQVMANTESLELGDYRATLTFTSEGDNSSASTQVPVTMAIPSVTPPAVGLSFVLSPGSSMTLPLAITNRNDKRVTWNASAGGTDWLTLDRYSNTLEPHEVQTIYATANSRTLDVGDYAATLIFSSEAEDYRSPTSQLPVELHVSFKMYSDDGPHIRRPIRKHGPHPTGSGEDTITYEVSNPVENGQIIWTMSTGGVGWVTLTPSEGVLQGGGQTDVVAVIDKNGLKNGNYRTDLVLTFSYDTLVNPEKIGREPTSVLTPLQITVP